LEASENNEDGAQVVLPVILVDQDVAAGESDQPEIAEEAEAQPVLMEEEEPKNQLERALTEANMNVETPVQVSRDTTLALKNVLDQLSKTKQQGWV
jgi:hypothetical protein